MPAPSAAAMRTFRGRSLPMENPTTVPTAEQMWGFPTLEEARNAQNTVLNKPMHEAVAFLRSLGPDIKAGRVLYRRPDDPQPPPMRGETAAKQRGVKSENIFVERASGSRHDQPVLAEALAACEKGDTLRLLSHGSVGPAGTIIVRESFRFGNERIKRMGRGAIIVRLDGEVQYEADFADGVRTTPFNLENGHPIFDDLKKEQPEIIGFHLVPRHGVQRNST